MTSELQEVILDQIVEMACPVIAAAERPTALDKLLTEIGWKNVEAAGLTLKQFSNALGACKGSLDRLIPLLNKESRDFADLTNGLAAALEAFTSLRGLGQNWKLPDNNRLPANLPQIFVEDLFNYLLDLQLCQRMPRFHAVMEFTGLLTREQANAITLEDGTVIRQGKSRPRWNFELLKRLLSDPVSLLRERYFEGAVRRSAEAVADMIGPAAAHILRAYGLYSWYGTPGAVGNTDLTVEEQQIAERFLHAIVHEPVDGANPKTLLEVIMGLIQTNGKLELVVVPSGNLSLDTAVGNWTLKASVEGKLQPLVISAEAVSFQGGEANPQLRLLLNASQAPPQSAGPLIRLGSESSTRFIVEGLVFKLRLEVRPGRIETGGIEIDALLEPQGALLAIAASEGDGFLSTVLPKSPILVPFDLAIGWTNSKGLYFRGSAGLQATLPVHRSLSELLTIESIYLALLTQTETQPPTVEPILAATSIIKLGPFLARAERFGLKADLTFPQSGGNLGVANRTLSFKLPDGVGLDLDAGAITGGGYLFFEEGQYAGVLELEVKGGIALKAIGLLTPRLPDGTAGFSLLLIISAEFPPLQLGFGFTLNGVGGLIGANRTMIVEVLRGGIKNHTLDAILFPRDPVKNAPQIISDLRSVFPAVSGRYVLGPMAKLGWGTPTLLTVELGILLELPQPVRLVLLGKLKLVLPEEVAPLVILQMDVLGGIDFEKDDASIDATLYDSRVAQYVITGDMAMRCNWGASPAFALAAGGFNPRFQPPPNFPSLNRLAISLATGDNPRIRLEAYLALTINTVQFGARLDVYAAIDVKVVGTFSAAAYLGFDVLVQLDPFHFIAEIDAGAVIKHNNHTLCSANLHLSLSGPVPWHAWGEATINFLGKHTIRFDITLASPDQAPLPALPKRDPLQLLSDAFNNTQNWSAQLPDNEHILVSLRQVVPSDEVLMHPFGTLTVRQKVLPLNITIAKIGNTQPTSQGPFVIEAMSSDTTTFKNEKLERVDDYFARGQFLELSDDEKLFSPAFDLMQSGVHVSKSSYTSQEHTYTYGHSVVKQPGYHTVVIDKEGENAFSRHLEEEYKLLQKLLEELAKVRAMGDKYAGISLGITLNETEYVVVSKRDLKQQADRQPPFRSYSEAQEALRNLQEQERKYLQVVASHEENRNA